MFDMKKRRHELKMTLREMADRMGVSHVSVWNWENGKSVPRKYNMKKIQRHYKQKYKGELYNEI